MEKVLRSQYWTVTLVIAVCLGLMALVLPRLPDKAVDFPLWALILGEYIFALVVLISTQFQSLRESWLNFKLIPGFVSIGLMFLVGAVGTVVSPVAALRTDGMISVGLAQLTIMNLGILFSIIIITRLYQFERADLTDEQIEARGVTHAKLERLTRIRLKAVDKTEDSLSTPEMPAAAKKLGDSKQITTDSPIVGSKQLLKRKKLKANLYNH